jgi:UDP-glucuronate 4-epimerase
MSRNILVTGGAGFIGSHLVDALLEEGDRVTVLDSFNDYYSPRIKRENVSKHLQSPHYKLIEGDIRDTLAVSRAFQLGPFDAVVHLAAMAGVRPSLAQPSLYIDVNVNGTQALLSETVKSSPQTRFIFGSSSAVYGQRSGEKFAESDRVDQPLSPYAASKAAGELICHSAHYIHNLPVVCLRFFTVYGPRQRPDLAIHKFCRKIWHGEPIEVYGDGDSKRDYTYVSDIVYGVLQSISYDCPGYDIINLGRSEPIILSEMIDLLQSALGKKALLNYINFQAGDMPYTFANIEKAKNALGYNPVVKFQDGLARFVEWFLAHQSIEQTAQNKH